ncbi:MAG: DNA methyltransferase, partial [Candidatus Hodarchaeales archaeon]
MDSLCLIQDFLHEYHIDIDPREILGNLIIEEDPNYSFTEGIIPYIIADAFNAANPIISKVTKLFEDKYRFLLGRVQKNQLKSYIDYREKKAFDLFLKILDDPFLMKREIELKDDIDNVISCFPDYRKDSMLKFNANLKLAISENRTKRIKDYLTFLYSRLLNVHTFSSISLNYLFQQNKKMIEKDLKPEIVEKLATFCESTEKDIRETIVNKFSAEYIRTINEVSCNFRIQNAIVYLNINQDLFLQFENKGFFYSYLLDLIKSLYEEVENHKAFVLRIQNIFDDDKNIKWELYSYLILYSEKFIRYQESRPFYFPDEIFIDCFEFKFSRKLSSEEKEHVKQYYNEKLSFDNLVKKLKVNDYSDMKDFLNSFKKINSGLTYIDTLIIRSSNKDRNNREIPFLKNEYEMLLILFKNEFNDYRIPCPVCGSLKISGNSFPEMGIRSWECKNPYCAERSKTNRGKRYSIKTIMMQNSTYDFSSDIQIPRELLKHWRRDVVYKWNLVDLYSMLVKYYSYPKDQILAINCDDSNSFKQISFKLNRTLIVRSADEIQPLSNRSETFSNFFNVETNLFFRNFVYKQIQLDKLLFDISFIDSNNGKAKLLIHDCNKIMNSFTENSIDHMVTSPPYYNAREYSCWQNLFTYMNDMYNHLLAAHRILKPGSVYFFNIGDIYDNEKTIVKSKIGDKRVPLGAYIIFLSHLCGFELIDNIIWDKGEPQTSRHKNDGKFVPFYQRPANCYEHMFIFKKKGAELKVSKEDNTWYWNSN